MYRKHFSLFFTLLTISSYALSAQEPFNYDSPPAAQIFPLLTQRLERRSEQNNSARSSTQTSQNPSLDSFLLLPDGQSSISNGSPGLDEQSSISNTSPLSAGSNAQQPFNHNSALAAQILRLFRSPIQQQNNSADSSTQTSQNASLVSFLFLPDEQSSTSNSSLLSTASLEQDYQDLMNQNQNDQIIINNNGRRVINNQGQQERNTRQRTGSPLPVVRLF